MGVSVYIPTPFRRATTNEARVDIEAGDVQELSTGSRGASRVCAVSFATRADRCTTTSTCT